MRPYNESTTGVRYDAFADWNDAVRARELQTSTSDNRYSVVAFLTGEDGTKEYYGFWVNAEQYGYVDNNPYSDLETMFKTIYEAGEYPAGTRVRFVADDFRKGKEGVVTNPGVAGYWRAEMDDGSVEYFSAGEVEVVGAAKTEATSGVSMVNSALRKAGRHERLVKGRGYYYLIGDDNHREETDWVYGGSNVSIPIYTIYPEDVPSVLTQIQDMYKENGMDVKLDGAGWYDQKKTESYDSKAHFNSTLYDVSDEGGRVFVYPKRPEDFVSALEIYKALGDQVSDLQSVEDPAGRPGISFADASMSVDAETDFDAAPILLIFLALGESAGRSRRRRFDELMSGINDDDWYIWNPKTGVVYKNMGGIGGVNRRDPMSNSVIAHYVKQHRATDPDVTADKGMTVKHAATAFYKRESSPYKKGDRVTIADTRTSSVVPYVGRSGVVAEVGSGGRLVLDVDGERVECSDMDLHAEGLGTAGSGYSPKQVAIFDDNPATDNFMRKIPPKILVYPPKVGHNQSGDWMAIWVKGDSATVGAKGLGKDKDSAVADLKSKTPV